MKFRDLKDLNPSIIQSRKNQGLWEVKDFKDNFKVLFLVDFDTKEIRCIDDKFSIGEIVRLPEGTSFNKRRLKDHIYSEGIDSFSKHSLSV
jgi:hypothetical protein